MAELADAPALRSGVLVTSGFESRCSQCDRGGIGIHTRLRVWALVALQVRGLSITRRIRGGMVYAPVLGTGVFGRESSSLSGCTTFRYPNWKRSHVQNVVVVGSNPILSTNKLATLISER